MRSCAWTAIGIPSVDEQDVPVGAASDGLFDGPDEESLEKAVLPVDPIEVVEVDEKTRERLVGPDGLHRRLREALVPLVSAQDPVNPC